MDQGSQGSQGAQGSQGPQGAQVTAEEILTIVKRRGQFDSLRKSLFTDFKDSDTNKALIAAIEQLVASDSSMTNTKSRGKAAALLEGSVNRSEAFGNMNRYIDERVSVRNDDLRRAIEELVKGIHDELSSGGIKTEDKTEK